MSEVPLYLCLAALLQLFPPLPRCLFPLHREALRPPVPPLFLLPPLGFRVQGSGFRVQGSGFRVQGGHAGFRAQD